MGPKKTFDNFGTGTFEDELEAGMWDEQAPDTIPDGGLGEFEDEACPDCGAPIGAPCDPMCPNADAPEGVDPDTAWDTRREGHEPGIENTEFDKFMDGTLLKESKVRTVLAKVDPQRQLARNYQEHPLGRVRMRGGR